MNITESIIADLLPLYASNECSADTRALVEGYLQQHPEVDRRLRRIMTASIPTHASAGKAPDEMHALRKARRLLRWQSWLMGFAIFFSLTPLSVQHAAGQMRWLALESPATAIVSATLGLMLWVIYALLRSRTRAL